MVSGEKWTKGDFPKVRCERCGEIVDSRIIERHHIILISEGGSEDPTNIQVLCPNCHRFIHTVEKGVNLERARERLVEKPFRESLKEILFGFEEKGERKGWILTENGDYMKDKDADYFWVTPEMERRRVKVEETHYISGSSCITYKDPKTGIHWLDFRKSRRR